ncbi:sulfatase family protein [Portibacter marinus]|uniref:sulfatase family protein n=1 Tax=Portibacter marinus TaxID=2898660 RepID=UPI001F3883B9|nr:arylsulfatase [Portibacter marinus]
MIKFKPIFPLFILLISLELFCQEVSPNIVIIYADDMGYGDLNCQNSDSKIPTPHLDRLAAEGMRFTDAHSSSGICSPSRFALLTGSYHWRRQHEIVGSFGPPFFKDSDVTLAHVLQNVGYETACIGKWHLGWDWEFINEPSETVEQWGRERPFYGPDDVVWDEPIKGGPLERGFNYYFGDGTINFPPYAWVENDRVMEAPTEIMDINNIGYDIREGSWEFRPGPKVKDWNPYEVLPTLTKKAVEWVHLQDASQPFFLYLALPSPHAPIIPNDKFIGKSNAGGYGDFVVQTDDVVGQVLTALRMKGLEENTIVIFTSDNGPEAYAWPRARDFGHFSMGNLRGLKRDVWEGGHRVPFIFKYEGVIKGGTVSDEVISQVDIFATLASMLNIDLDPATAPDSYDISSILNGQSTSTPIRQATIHNTYESIWGIRKGDWLMITDKTGGHREIPEFFKEIKNYEDFRTDSLLFNMESDPQQLQNLYLEYPDKVKELNKLLKDHRQSKSSVDRSQ